MKTMFCFFALAFLSAAAFCAGTPVLKIGLKESEELAISNSNRLKAALQELEAAKSRANSQYSQLYPRLTLDGTLREVSEVPSITVPIPGAKSIKLGDNLNYSLGPSAVWTVWDAKGIYNQWLSFKALEKSKKEEADAIKKQVILSARQSYFQAQLALEELRLISDSLKLAQSQYSDIDKRLRAGVSSRIDSLYAHQEALDKRRQFRQAQTTLADALKDIFSLTGEEPNADVSLPAHIGMAGNLPVQIDTPTAYLDLDSLESSHEYLAFAFSAKPDMSHPGVNIYMRMAEASRLSAKAMESGNWPKFQLSARTSLDYPNGPIIESFNQNTIGITASVPLFEGGRTREQAKEQEQLARASEERKLQAGTDLLRDWQKAKYQITGLTAQEEINAQSVQEAEELAKLVYSSYKAGSSTFLEVQSANVRALEAKTQSSRTKVQILMQLAVLANLSQGE